MSNFANLNEENIVIRVAVGNPELSDEDNLKFMQDSLGGKWIQTSYNTAAGVHKLGGQPLRKNYAGEGMIYDEERDAFLYPQPYNSWALNEETCLWEPPLECPNDGNMYEWDEETTSWVIKEIIVGE